MSNSYPLVGNDISMDFHPSQYDSQVIRRILKHESTPRAIRLFADQCHGMTDYGYWFVLGTLWVSYTGWSDLNLWRNLFSSTRPRRDTSLMKPSELIAFRSLPDPIPCFRAHRPQEADWLSLTLSAERAAMFATQRGVDHVALYELPKDAALCLFLRRREQEILTLRKDRATFVRNMRVVRTTTEVDA